MGELAKANDANLEEVQDLGRQAVIAAEKYGLPALKVLLTCVGVPGPFAELMASTVKYSVDCLRDNDTEQAELRALTAQQCTAHAGVARDIYKNTTPERVRSLYQRVTKKATEIRQGDRVSVVIAATFGGSDEEMASPEDLYAAEWLEQAPESKLTLLRDLTKELFGDEVIPEIIEGVPLAKTTPTNMLLTPCIQAPNREWMSVWLEKSSWWAGPNFKQELFLGTQRPVYHGEEGKRGLATAGGERYKYDVWPSGLLQRVHNAFARSRQMMAFDLKQAAEAAADRSDPD